MDEQQKVAAFFEEQDMRGDPAYQILALAAEVGEIADDAAKSTSWGADPAGLQVKSDEIGDALFCLLALSESLGIDAGDALEESLAKYRARIEDPETPYTGDRYEADPD